MAINQINTAAFDYAMMLSVINLSYKTQADITLTNYDNDTAPQVTAGSIFVNNGAQFENTTLVTPTGYAGLTNSTTFYLYYDESGGVFIFSNTVPTWSDAKQGWYNGNDRAFFSIFKDSGGTLYQTKLSLIHKSNNQIAGGLQTDNILVKTHVVPIGIWDMTGGTKNVTLPTGITYANIISIIAMVRNDANTGRYHLQGINGGYTLTSTQITLEREAGGIFNGANFNDGGLDRGIVTIQYEV